MEKMLEPAHPFPVTQLRLEVVGIPVPQGSMRVFANKAGRAWATSDNTKLRPWRDSVAWMAREAMGGRSPLTGPIHLGVLFTLPRPRGHYGKKGIRPAAPRLPVVKPDLDKLLRGIGDALTAAGVWRDDALVCRIVVTKVYGEQPGAVIEVASMEDSDG